MKRTHLIAAMSLSLLALASISCRRGETPKQPPRTASKPAARAAEQAEVPSKPPDIGDAMPAYSGHLLDGKEFDLAAEKGNVVLLNVWATWCGPCRYEIPQLQALHDKYAPRGFKVIGVSVDETDGSGVKQFVEDQKMRYPIALDPDGRIANVLQTMVLPTSVLIDRQGKIAWRQIGALSPDDAKLKAAIDSAIAQPPAH